MWHPASPGRRTVAPPASTTGSPRAGTATNTRSGTHTCILPCSTQGQSSPDLHTADVLAHNCSPALAQTRSSCSSLPQAGTGTSAGSGTHTHSLRCSMWGPTSVDRRRSAPPVSMWALTQGDTETSTGSGTHTCTPTCNTWGQSNSDRRTAYPLPRNRSPVPVRVPVRGWVSGLLGLLVWCWFSAVRAWVSARLPALALQAPLRRRISRRCSGTGGRRNLRRRRCPASRGGPRKSRQRRPQSQSTTCRRRPGSRPPGRMWTANATDPRGALAPCPRAP
mmetsp:Transcript_93904/g.265716  ORF Transcript_93904/g.265716 Transcript_93904/m.265716 type:complete len:278 (-) Transcript_93904:755-1588(-)